MLAFNSLITESLNSPLGPSAIPQSTEQKRRCGNKFLVLLGESWAL